MFQLGQKQGELCRRDNDCETGLMCAEIPGSETRSCQPPVTSNKLYSKRLHPIVTRVESICVTFLREKRRVSFDWWSTKVTPGTILRQSVNYKLLRDARLYLKVLNPVPNRVITDEECNMSGECDISRGLCCQLQRRHRQTPRKVSKISYFSFLATDCTKSTDRKSSTILFRRQREPADSP